MFKTAEAFANRLTAVERMKIRAASEDGLARLFYVDHRFEIDAADAEGMAIFKEAVALINEQFRVKSASAGF